MFPPLSGDQAASTPRTYSLRAWVRSRLGAVLDADDPRSRGVTASTITLLVLSTAAALAVPGLTVVRTHAGAAVTTGVLVAMPFAFWLAWLLVRSGWPWASAGFSLAASSVAAVVVAFVQPELAALASVGFMLAAVLVIASLFLPFRVAGGLAALNAAGAIALPRFLPEAGARTIEVPYVFLAVNVVLFIAYAALRQRELERLHRTEEHLATQTIRVQELEADVGAQRSRHEREVADLNRQHKDQQAFLSAASHELRTPLTPILIQLSLLRNADGELTPKQQRHLNIIERNLDRLGILVGDLLDVARIGSGRVVIEPRDIDLETLARETADSFAAHAEEKTIHLDMAIQGPLEVHADPIRISQVLYNLLSNALKYTPAGGRVSILAHRDLDGVYVGIQDDGPGLTEMQRLDLFKPFSQVQKPEAKQPGTGLGLYISQGILRQHDGRIWAESDGPGKGSTFSFWLPRGEVGATQDAATADVESRPPTHADEG